ncbi:MAG: bicyclomycin resistance protein [Leptothrix sp. (in: Bacteria)]|nr:bicyclomycin resistance protein [Leptothrix sp. (in: b-proteobacteria)]
MKRRALLAGGAALAGGLAGSVANRAASAAVPAPTAAAASRTLRVAFDFAETGFDPPRVGDQSSIRVIAHIFEPLLTYDLLARPAVLVPQTAAALPEASADFRRFVVTLQPGILFADDPVFQGRPRELVAADYVYTFKRFYDPAIRTEHLYLFENEKILGLSELRAAALKSRTPFPYDAPVAGLRVLDRYRLEVVLAAPSPRFTQLLAGWMTGAVAREVIEAFADDPQAHPVGTGPFRLAQWRRASRIVLERNPSFREQVFHTVGAAPELQHFAAQLAGVRAPRVDRVEIDIVEESQPRWLAFLNGEHDVLTVPRDLGQLAMPGGRLAPFLQRQGVVAERQVNGIAHTFINQEDAVIGGLAPERVALRRAVMLAYDSAEELRLVFNGQGLTAQSLIPPGTYGHDPGLRSEMSAPSPARAQALLDLYGYLDRDGDGWREAPDGRPLTLRIAFTPDRRARASSEVWLRRMKAVGLRVVFEFAPFGELIRRSLAGQIMMWGFIWSSSPDGDFFLGLAYGPNAGQSNDARFRLPAFDRLYEQQRVLPNGPERLALMQQAQRLLLAYVPYIAHYHPAYVELFRPRVSGPLRHPFNSDWYRWVNVR